MAIITIMSMPNSFPQGDLVCQFIRICSLWDGGMGVNGEPNKNGSANGCPQDEEISGCPLFHKIPSLASDLVRLRPISFGEA